MITILHIAEIILYIILAFNTGYLLLFAIASKFCRPRIPSYSKITHGNYMTLS